MTRYCTNEACRARKSCALANPVSDVEASHEFGDWYIAGPLEECLSYEPTPLVVGGQGHDTDEIGAAAWTVGGCLLAIVIVIAIALLTGC